MVIVNVLGSPRTAGNGATVAQLLLDVLDTHHNKIISHELNKLNYRGCQACMACKKNADTCITKDELTPVIEDIKKADVVILSSPVYFGEITAQAKGLVDRLYSFYGADFRTNPRPSRLAKGKALVLILPQGNADETAFAEIIPRYMRIFTRLGFDAVLPIRALGVGVGSNVAGSEAILKAVAAASAQLRELTKIN